MNNKTDLEAYSRLDFVNRTRFWIKTIFIPTIIWFVAAPLFVIAMIGHLLFEGAPSYSSIKAIAIIGFIIGVIYIARKNLSIISAIEKEHSIYSNGDRKS